MKDPRAFWDWFSKKYDANVAGRYKRTYADTVALAGKNLKRNDLLLEYGCGTGLTTIALAPRVKKVIAIDISEGMIEIARAKAERAGMRNIEFVHGDVLDRVLKNEAFDAVTAFNVLHFLKEPERTVSRLRDLLKPRGFLLSATDCLGESRPFTYRVQGLLSRLGFLPSYREYSFREFERLIAGNGFEIFESRVIYPNPPNCYVAAKKA